MPKRVRSSKRRNAARRSRKYRRRVGRIGRTNTKFIRGKFCVDGATGFYWRPTSQTNNAAQATPFENSTGLLPAFFTNGSNTSNALVYRFDFPISFLSFYDASFSSIRNAWDLFRIDKVAIKLSCSVDPRETITQGFSSSAYDFSQAPSYNQDFSWIEYDGLPAVNADQAYALQGNGDCTDEVQNRNKAKSHKAFGTIYRSMRPTCSMPVLKEVSQPYGDVGAVSNLTTTVVNKRPWLTNISNAPYTGSIMVAVSYKGQSSGSSGTQDYQPKYYWTAHSYYWISFKCPLFG